MSTSDIRVRIAPSPSGNLHVGTARTALFNYLFAKKHGGKFILRIEDTDLERTDEKYVQNIFDSLKAMGLNWDEGPDVGGDFGPYKQSQRFERYIKYVQILIDKGFAYECWCTQEELDKEKELAAQSKNPSVYSGKCINLTPEQKEIYLKEGRKPAIRFKMPSAHLKFNDLIKGELSFDTSLMGDFVIMKSNDTPTYNFAVVIDDMEMKISHIIRGEDHISNTPRQIAIYEALDAKIPEFAHVGMILAPDRTKLSKRHGATAVSEFIRQGYLPDAFVNFIALLGWTPSDGHEIKSIDQIIEDFSLEHVSSSNSIFEFDKLNWMNGQYIRSMPISELTERIKPYLEKYDLSEFSQDKLEKIVAATREPYTVLSDATDAVEYFFGQDVSYDEQTKDVLQKVESKTVLGKFLILADELAYEDLEELHGQLDLFRKSFEGLKAKQIMWAIRAALTGRLKGADISQVISVLGKEKLKYRTEKAISGV
ncbi:MAG: glutamate--tRNA ligase [Candidatus Gastranaerophilaceae bacterium]